MFPFISNAYAQSKQVAPGNNFMTALLNMAPILGIFAVFYLVILRPKIKEQKAVQELLDNLGTGDEVVTTSGMMGKVVGVKDQNVELKIAKEVEITIEKMAIKQILPKGTVRFN